MIKGIGIDVSKIPRFDRIIQSKYFVNFIKKVLCPNEIDEINEMKNVEMKSRYLATRWAAKEALVKALGNKGLVFSKVYIAKEETG
jgi:phosphopantetheine--protein transferase-like protein